MLKYHSIELAVLLAYVVLNPATLVNCTKAHSRPLAAGVARDRLLLLKVTTLLERPPLLQA